MPMVDLVLENAVSTTISSYSSPAPSSYRSKKKNRIKKYFG
jgi:hypothetical protein